MAFLPTLQLINKSHIISNVPQGYEAVVLSEIVGQKKDVIFVASDEGRALELKNQVAFFHPHVEILWFPPWDCLPYDRVSPHSDIQAMRIDTLTKLLENSFPQNLRLVITTVASFLQRVPPQSIFQDQVKKLSAGDSISFENLITFLMKNNYSRHETVRDWGEFAIRGGLIDLFPAGTGDPLRLDFFGDKIESIKTFSPATQMSTGTITQFVLKPMSELLLTKETIQHFRKSYRESFEDASLKDPLYESISEERFYPGAEHWLPLFYEGLQHLTDYAPHAVIVTDPQMTSSLHNRLDQIEDHYQARQQFLQVKQVEKGIPYHPLPPDKLYMTALEWGNLFQNRGQIKVHPFALPENQENVIDVQAKTGVIFATKTQKFGSSFDDLKDYITNHQKQGRKVTISALSAGSLDRLTQILEDHGLTSFEKCLTFHEVITLPKNIISLITLPISHGFITPKYVLITEEDILGEKLGQVQKKRKKNDFLFIDMTDLEVGDWVVHIEHGIGQYQGLKTLNVGGFSHDCLEVHYEGNDKLFVPVENIDVLSRYGSKDQKGTLDRLGGSAWQAKKARVKQRIREIAEHLLRIAAERHLHDGEIIPKPEGSYDEFIAHFPYDETDDQLTAVEEIFTDLNSGKPMDRLVCGDVGFGKTEVAMRAAFAVAMAGKQVAVVVPTTLLARQHYKNFEARFQATGLKVAQLSRLIKPSQAKLIRQQLAEGEINIVVGTHALLGESVKFHDLGLLIIDEEQHFGVSQKEKLKELRADIHVLTLTATPIPRTLQLALTGVRELSLITTPPVDRMAVRTFILPFDDVVIREAILRERFRGGQTFYVCPRISDLEKIAERLRRFVPEVKVALVHGQMTPSALENIMSDFCDGEYDVLLSTQIIESGLDIPRANTLIIHRADMFGLAQLYQLRGRVGRSKIRGYAYLTLSNTEAITTDAQKRLEVMQSLDGLGAGFSLASHDMDIRGAGNLLGDEQSGHIKEVGVELYQQMLEETIASLKNKEIETEQEEKNSLWSPQINLGMPVLIPEDYIPELNLRLQLYRRMSRIETKNEIDAFSSEFIDRFGSYPEEVRNLLDIMYLKVLCRQTGIEKVGAGPKGVVFSLRNNTYKEPLRLVEYIQKQAGTAKIRPDQKIVFIRAWENAAIRMKAIKGILEDIAVL